MEERAVFILAPVTPSTTPAARNAPSPAQKSGGVRGKGLLAHNSLQGGDGPPSWFWRVHGELAVVPSREGGVRAIPSAFFEFHFELTEALCQRYVARSPSAEGHAMFRREVVRKPCLLVAG